MNQLDKDSVKCSVCKTNKSDAWYMNETADVKSLCNFCCDSSGFTDPKTWVGLCVHCLKNEAAYPIYKLGLKQYTCCDCYVAHRKQVKKDRTAVSQKRKEESKRVKKTGNIANSLLRKMAANSKSGSNKSKN